MGLYSVLARAKQAGIDLNGDVPAEPAPSAQCGRVSERLWDEGWRYEPCAREVGHPGFCEFVRLP